MNEKLRAVLVILVVVILMTPVYILAKYFQKVIRPGESLGRLLLYLIACLALIFVFSFLIVFLIKTIFQPAPREAISLLLRPKLTI